MTEYYAESHLIKNTLINNAVGECMCYVIKDSTSVNDTMQNQFKKFKWVGVT